MAEFMNDCFNLLWSNFKQKDDVNQALPTR